MRLATLKWFIYTVLSGFLFISCAGTKLTDTWVDKAHQGKHVSNILIIGLTFEDNEAVRQSFENSFVKHLREAGIEAISSLDTIPCPPDMELKKEEILAAVKKFNNDAVIITHLVGKDAKYTYSRSDPIFAASDYDYYMYYGWAYGGRGYSRSSETVYLATSLYDVKTEKLIWSGKSKTFKPESNRQMFDDVVSAVIKDLQKDDIIPKK